MWFFILSGLMAFTGKPVSSSCPLKMSPPRVVVRFGDPLLANCSSLSHETDGMGWESSYGGTGLKNVSSIVLSIPSVKDWKIEPQCFINYDTFNQCLNILPVTVYKMPDSVSMSQPSQTIHEGQEYSMQCDIVNVAPARNLSVHWYKGNKMFFTDTFNESHPSPVNKSSVIKQLAHRDDDGAQIWCEAKLNLWLNLFAIPSTSHEMIVQYPPVFTKPENETLELPAGSKINLNCTAAGNPMPAYSWHFPHPVQRTNKDQNENQPTLTPSFELPGIYTCTASNSLGNKTKYFTVIEATSSHPGTTAGILMAVFFILIFTLGCVVYHKQRNSSVARAEGNRTTFAALLGGFSSLGVLLGIVGLLTMTPEGTFSFSKSSYLRGRPTSSGPV